MVLEPTQPSKRNEYPGYFLETEGGRLVGLISLQPSFADCLEIWDPQPTGTLRACPGLFMKCISCIVSR